MPTENITEAPMMTESHMMTESQAWTWLGEQFERAGAGGVFVGIGNQLRLCAGLCLAISILKASGTVSNDVTRSMQERLRQSRPDKATGLYWWRTHDEEGNQKRAAFCRTMALKAQRYGLLKESEHA
jgi:hypothetical protein